MIIRSRVVITMDGPPIENGAVAISENQIRDVGPVKEVRARYSGARTRSSDEEIDLGERALLPGLINAHCHLDYTCLRGKIMPQRSFTDWIRAINAAKANLTPNDYIKAINEGSAEARRFGTTTIVNLTAFPELIQQARPQTRTHWMPELIDVRAPEKAEDIVRNALKSLEGSAGALAPHAPYTASPALYRLAQQSGIPTTHLAESREEMQMFRDESGPLYDFIRSINPAFRSEGLTPLQYFMEKLHAGGPWLIAHLNELDESDFGLLAVKRPNCALAHCPRSHQYFVHSPFQFPRLRALGFPICLGTDSLASNTDLNLFAEMRAFRAAFPNASGEEVLAMVTRNPGLPRVGVLRSNYLADMVAVAVRGCGPEVYEEVIATEAEPWVMINGVCGTI